jgi:hypothetical protein
MDRYAESDLYTPGMAPSTSSSIQIGAHTPTGNRGKLYTASNAGNSHYHSTGSIPVRAMIEPVEDLVAAPTRRGGAQGGGGAAGNIVLHQVWGGGASPQGGRSLRLPGLAQQHYGASKTAEGGPTKAAPRRAPGASTLHGIKKVNAVGKDSVEVLNERLDRMARMVAQSLRKGPRRLPKARPQTTGPTKKGKSQTPGKFKKSDALIRPYGDLNLPEHAELQKWVDSYQREQAEYSSFALHAESHMQRLNLLGPVPNRLALAVCMDVLGRLPDVVGRFGPIVRKVHGVLFASAYLPADKTIEQIATIEEVGTPKTLAGYYNRAPFFMEYEKAKSLSEEILAAVKDLGVKGRATVRFMAGKELHTIASDVLLGRESFTSEVRIGAMAGLRPKEAAKIVINALELSRTVLTSNQMVGVILSALKVLKQDERGAIYEALLEDSADGKGMMDYLVNEADDLLKSELLAALGGGGGAAGNGLPSKRSLHSVEGVANAVDGFLAIATESDVEVLRKIIMKADADHGVQWKLILPWAEEVDPDDHADATEAQIKVVAKMKQKQAELEVGETKLKTRASKVIRKLRSNVHLGQKHRRKKKKHKISMAKFKTAAKTVMMTKNLAATDLPGGGGRAGGTQALDISEAFEACTQCSGAEIDASLHALSTKSEDFIKWCQRGKRKILVAIESLVTNELKTGKDSTVEDWDQVIGECGLHVRPDMEAEIYTALGAPGGSGNIYYKEILGYLDQMVVLDNAFENDIRSKMFGSGEKDSSEWMIDLVQMVELATEKAKKTKKKLFIRVPKGAFPPSFDFEVASSRIPAGDFLRASTKPLHALLKVISELIPEYLRSEILALSEKQQAPASFASFVYNHFLAHFGLPKIADVNLLGLVASVLSMKGEHARISHFAQFFLGTEWDDDFECYCRSITHADKLDRKDLYSPNRKLAQRKSSIDKGSKSPPKKGKLVARKSKDLPVMEVWEVRVKTMAKVASESMHRVSQELWDEFYERMCMIARKPEASSGATLAAGPGNSSPSPKRTAKKRSDSKSYDSEASSVTDGESPRKSPRKQQQRGSGESPRRGSVDLDAVNYDNYVVNVDDCMGYIMSTLREDRGRKIDYLVSLFTAVDVDGNGELSVSEFTTLVHSLDPMISHKMVLNMYRESMVGADGEMTTSSFVQAIKDHGLMHMVVDSNNKLSSVQQDMDALQRIWQCTKPFIEGTLEALSRDLDQESDLFSHREAGDSSLKGINERLLNFEKLLLEGSQAPLAWQSYWILLREFWNAAKEGPGIMTIYPRGEGTGRRTEAITRSAERNTMETPAKSRARRESLPHIMFPRAERVAVKMPSSKPMFEGEEGGGALAVAGEG